MIAGVNGKRQIMSERSLWRGKTRPDLLTITAQLEVSAAIRQTIAAEGMQKAKDHQKVESDMEKTKK